MRNRIVVQYGIIQGAYDVWILDVSNSRGRRCLISNAMAGYHFQPQEEGTCFPDTPFRLERHEAQSLMDDLYRAGLRPVDAQGTAGQVEAMASHLKDMRSLAFKGNPP